MLDSRCLSNPESISPCRTWSRALRFGACLLLCVLANLSVSQEYTSVQRRQAQAMLRDVTNDVRENYYDQHLHGVDWDAKVRGAKEKIDKADSMNSALSVIAAVLDSLNDSHTLLIPPPRPYINDYGFEMQMIGDRCYATHVRPGSDAATKGLMPGDQILTVNGYTPTRDSFSRMHYLFWILRPQPGFRLSVRTPDGNVHQIDVMAKFQERPNVRNLHDITAYDLQREAERQRQGLGAHFVERDNDLLVVKLDDFLISPIIVDSIVSKMEGRKAVIFDLRGNPGGSEETLEHLLGTVLEHKVKIGDRVRKGKAIAINTELRLHKFPGRFIVLVDSRSTSASEAFARVIQLEKRGTVIGDRTSGSVMAAVQFSHMTYGDRMGEFLFYGAEVTEADLIMADGQSLEHKGVTPDQLILPTASDLANGRDPVMAKAAELLNVKMTPEEAGALFPYEWPKE